MSRYFIIVLMILIDINLLAKEDTKPSQPLPPGYVYDPTRELEYNEKMDAKKELDRALDALSKCKKNENKKECKTEINSVRWAKDKARRAGVTIEKDQIAMDCDDDYETFNNDYKECKPSHDQFSDKCSMHEDTGLMSSEMQGNLAPLAGLVSGADTLMDVYSAMNFKPGCQYSKSDFNDKEASLKTQADEIEEKIRENKEKAQQAQKDYADQLNTWSDEEQELLEQISEIPAKKQDDLEEEDRKKIDAKIKAESDFASNNLRIAQLTVQYNAKIDSQKTKLKENSEFAIADKCQTALQTSAATNQSQPVQPLTITYRGVLTAAGVGQREKKVRESRYNQCADVYRSQVRELLNSIASDLNMIKTTINEIERQNGAIQENLTRLSSEVAKIIEKIYLKYENETKKLRERYQRLQAKREAERVRVSGVLQSLSEDNQALSKKLSVLKLKLQSFVTGIKPQNTDKSVSRLLEDCSDFDSFYEEFNTNCCSGEYTGGGKRLCKKASKSEKKLKGKKGAGKTE